MQNLYKETTEVLANNGKGWNDVCFLRTARNRFDVEDAMEMMNFEYDAGFGLAEVDQSLTVVGDDWWLERAEYDGSEWWEFKTMPKDFAEPTRPYPHDTFFIR